MSFINSHYYILIQDWMNIMDKLRTKARYVIITTIAKHKEYFCMASGWGRYIRRYFKEWELVSKVDQLSREGDPHPRSLGTYCFKNPHLERQPMEKLGKGNHVQGQYYKEIDAGILPLSTRYYKVRRKADKRKGKPLEDSVKYIYDKVDMYESLKKWGVKEPIIVNNNYKILDGNHRKEILEYLGYKSTIVRKT